MDASFRPVACSSSTFVATTSPLDCSPENSGPEASSSSTFVATTSPLDCSPENSGPEASSSSTFVAMTSPLDCSPENVGPEASSSTAFVSMTSPVDCSLEDSGPVACSSVVSVPMNSPVDCSLEDSGPVVCSSGVFIPMTSPVDCGPMNSYPSVTEILAETYHLRERPRCRCKMRRMYWAALFCLLNAVAMGFATGYSAPATYLLKHSSIEPSDEQLSWIASVLALGAMFGGMIGGPLSDKIGRRSVLLLNVLVMILGWFSILEAISVSPIIFGRFVTGLGCGIISVAVPMYCVEIATPEVRGLLGSLFQTFMVMGNLFCFLIGSVVTWEHLALVAAAVAGIAMVLFSTMPESPKWWLMNGERFRAHMAIRGLQGPHLDVDRECNRIHEDLQSQPKGRIKLREWKNPMVWKPALLTLGMMFFQQCSGANAILFYSTQIFDANKEFMDPKAASIILGVMQVVATFVSNLLVDRTGRKLLLLLSGAIMGISQLALSLFYYETMTHSHLRDNFPWIPLVCICAFIVAFSIGFGPLPWLLAAEMVPLRVRSSVGGLATFSNGLFAFGITKTFGLMLNVIHDYGAFMMYGIISSLSCIFVLVFLPETKGKEIEEIAVFFCKDLKKRTESLREILTEEINSITSFPPFEEESPKDRSHSSATVQLNGKTIDVSDMLK